MGDALSDLFGIVALVAFLAALFIGLPLMREPCSTAEVATCREAP